MGQALTREDSKAADASGMETLRLQPLAYPWRGLAMGLAAVLVIGLVASGIGSVYIPPMTVLKILMDKVPLVGFEATWIPRASSAGVVAPARISGPDGSGTGSMLR